MGEEEHVENRGWQAQTVHRLAWPHGPRAYQLTVPATRRLHVLVPCGVRIVVKDAKEKRIGCWERSWATHRLERERVERGESDGIVCESSLRRNSPVTSAAAAATRRTVPVMIDVLIGQVL